MKKIVQLEISPNFFNLSLQRQLLNNKEFSARFDLIVLNMEELRARYAEECRKYRLPRLISKLRFWGFNQFLEKEYGDLEGEIVSIQSVIWKYILILPFLKKHFRKIVLSFWGSDILRVSKIILHLEKRLFDNADIITFISDDMINRFTEVFKKRYLSKIRKADFGSEILDYIDAIDNEDVDRFKKKYGISRDSQCLVIGYNRYKDQRHTEIIQSILKSGLSPEIITLVFPWTYGPDDREYLKEIESLILGKYEYAFLKNRLTDEEVACLRKATDIFVQTQITDALSSSMLETLYAEKEIITGRWLHYDELDQAGVQLRYVDSVDEVGSAINDILANPLSDDSKKHNKEITEKMCSWKYRINDWLDIYLPER